MATLQERLDGKDIIILDGAVGTELQRRGAPMDDMAWCATAIKTHPETVRAMHEDYIRAGADVITANTFSTSRHVLEGAGLGDEVGAINRRAVELAREARDAVADRSVWIAGSMSTMVAGLDGENRPTPEQAKANFRELAGHLAEAGADLLVMEMMMDTERASPAVEAAVATGLPVWVGFSCRLADDGETVLMYHTRPGVEKFHDVIEPIMAIGGSAAGVMHSKIEDTGPALDVLFEHWSGPVSAYPETGDFTMPNWEFVNIVSPDDLAATMQGWVEKGVQIVGGCCGTGPEHIRALKERMPARLPA